ncbi:MAG: hypothetical protein K2N22_03995 [Clostridia bacterium]|nr:hypothetical protein [Clostridia bacterium]
MIEIELFFKTVESEIRRRHIKYLKKQKCLPEGSAALLQDENAEDKEEFEKLKGGDKLKFVKRYNKGIETALKALQSEYKTFAKRLEAEDKKGSKF